MSLGIGWRLLARATWWRTDADEKLSGNYNESLTALPGANAHGLQLHERDPPRPIPYRSCAARVYYSLFMRFLLFGVLERESTTGALGRGFLDVD